MVKKSWTSGRWDGNLDDPDVAMKSVAEGLVYYVSLAKRASQTPIGRTR
jgi:hypothetical protein